MISDHGQVMVSDPERSWSLTMTGHGLALTGHGLTQGCSGAGTRQSDVLANIFEPERRSGK